MLSKEEYKFNQESWGISLSDEELESSYKKYLKLFYH